MEKKAILPKEVIEHTTEYYVARSLDYFESIYISITFFLITLLSSLPLLFVDVSVKSHGILRATTEISTLKATSTGYIQEVRVKENEAVEKGQLLFTVHAPVLEEKEKYLMAKLQESADFIEDLNKLVAGKTTPDQLITNLYRQSHFDYRQKLIDRQTKFLKVKQDYERNKKLYDQKVIAAADFENFQFELDKSKNEIELLKQSQLSQWQQELRNYEREVTDLQNQLAQTQKEKENLNIKAPVSGTVQNLTGVYPGSTVFAGQELAQISPDTDLLAEVYVSPNDIGLLRPGMDVRMQIGAFNYNQWGLLNGKVKEISNDIQIMDNRPMFEVKCSLEKEYLTLKNGYKGNLKKGMTLQARFVVTKRSLWQLLYDKADDWLNPNIIAEPILTK
ncbi:MAG: HlyD family secretion protein [Cyclobacteriaceae bacterium]